MPRAAGLFRKAGVDFVPCPADYAAGGGVATLGALPHFDSEALEHSTMAVHEWIGLAWNRLRGSD
jgi:uncharacterized SAM-binding protein YcdF (DUF218 family)